MGKALIEKKLGEAFEVINNTVAKDGAIDSTYRSKMSAFGGAIVNNGLISALCYFQKNEEKIVEMIKRLDDSKELSNQEYIDRLKGLKGDVKLQKTREILDYSVSLKLAMNCFIKDKG